MLRASKCFRTRGLVTLSHRHLFRGSDPRPAAGYLLSSRTSFHSVPESDPWKRSFLYQPLVPLLKGQSKSLVFAHSANGRLLFSSSADYGDKKPPAAKVAAPLLPSEQQVADTKILRTLATYLWIKGNMEFRLRVIAALGFLVGAKVLNVQVPFLFKLAVDWLSVATTGDAHALASFTAANSTLVALFATPAAVLVGYGIARTGASAFNGTPISCVFTIPFNKSPHFVVVDCL